MKIDLKDLYFKMLRIRVIEEKLSEVYISEQKKRIELGKDGIADFNPNEEEMRCPVHFSIGQEAVAVGVCANLKDEDLIFSHHRSIAHYLAKGGDLNSFISELYGKKTGMTAGKGGQTRVVDIKKGIYGSSNIVGGTIPIAVGAALAAKIKKEEIVVVVFFGDGACEEGIFHESLNFAALRGLPVVFVCENNFYAVQSSMLSRQVLDNIYRRAEIYGIPGYRVDGNDIEEVFRRTVSSIYLVRQFKTPVLIEARTFRWKEHVGPKFHSAAGASEEFKKWQEHCPIQRLEESLLDKNILDAAEIFSLKKKFMTEAEEAIKFAKESLLPDSEDLLKNVY